MKIKVRYTPNHNTIKLMIGIIIKRDLRKQFFKSKIEGQLILIKKLFSISGIENILLGYNFISITKNNINKWNDIKSKAIEIIMEHIILGIYNGYKKNGKDKCNNIDRLVICVIENKIRPLINIDGGELEYIKYGKGILYIKLNGSCLNCLYKNVTLEKFIKRKMKKYISEIKCVIIIR